MDDARRARRVVLALSAGAWLAVAAARAEAQCSCTPTATPCPTTCATCATSTRCCNCTNPCDYGGCGSSYNEISADFCAFPPGSFAETCQRCTSVTNGSCATCPPGRYSSTCQECPGGAANPCNGHGTCSQGVSGSGTCTCLLGFNGPACQYSDAINCNGHGTVSYAGTCSCQTGYTGATCNQCAASYYGYPTCTYCDAATTCSGHGTCDATGACICAAGFAPPACADCAAGWFGASCASECPGGAANACNGNGACDDGIAGTGQCGCNPGFVAPDCQTVCGDVDDDGGVDGDDLALFRAHLADPFSFPLTPAGESKCTVVGEAGPCDLLDVVVLARSLESPPLAPGRAPVCAAVTGP